MRNAPLEKGIRVVKLLYNNRPLEELRMLVSFIVSGKGCAALLATTGDKNQVIAGRSEDVDADLKRAFNAVLLRYGGSGGGSGKMVQGGFESAEAARGALDMLHKEILEPK